MNKGDQGELLFKSIMIDKGYIVNDVTNTPYYWDQDIDFICKSPTTGLVKSFEVKWDYSISYTKNLFLEFYNPRSKGERGWWEFCKADYIAYGDAINKIFYIIDRQKLEQRVRALQLSSGRTSDGSEGLLCPIGLIADLIKTL